MSTTVSLAYAMRARDNDRLKAKCIYFIIFLKPCMDPFHFIVHVIDDYSENILEEW